MVGPTASGKSSVALLLCEALNGELISVDSMQVYRGLDIGTAKPSPEERRRVPHHLIELVVPGDSFDAAQFCQHSRQAITSIRSRNRTALFRG